MLCAYIWLGLTQHVRSSSTIPPACCLLHLTLLEQKAVWTLLTGVFFVFFFSRCQNWKISFTLIIRDVVLEASTEGGASWNSDLFIDWLMNKWKVCIKLWVFIIWIKVSTRGCCEWSEASIPQVDEASVCILFSFSATIKTRPRWGGFEYVYWTGICLCVIS